MGEPVLLIVVSNLNQQISWHPLPGVQMKINAANSSLRATYRGVLLLVALCILSPCQSDERRVQLSGEPLSTDQVAIYRTVLEKYTNDTKDNPTPINLADKTEPLDEFFPSEVDPCLRKIGARSRREAQPLVHRLQAALIQNLQFRLVDADRQEDKIKQNDPQNLVRQSIDGGKAVTDEQVGQAVREAFANGLFTLSEIAFNQQHNRAVVSYGFRCGMLCGHGAILVLKKVGADWKIAKECGSWVS